MEKGRSKFMKIKINTETGEVVKIKGVNNEKPIEVSDNEVEQILQDPNTTNIAKLLHTHSSPGCIYIVSGGWAYKFCWGS
jgi:hypothetical protein